MTIAASTCFGVTIIVFNLIGAGILILACALGAGVGYLFGAKSQAPMMLVAGLVALVLDLIYRIDKGDGSLFHPRRGGHICFIPAWGIGLGLFMLGALYVVLPENGRELTPEHRQGLLPQAPPPRSALRADSQTVPVHPQRAELKLTMISGTPQRRLATINGETFAPGETHGVNVAQRRVVLTCLEIGEQSVNAQIAGASRPLELKFGEPVPLE
ncbi:MAG TPA: hypothetical protein VG167_04925 [Verrucomicrobiae bacterium]|nr:hypothetical protein [Verrucomicrobiae bacterium]